MSEFKCCHLSEWVSVLDLPHADSCEFILGECSHCRNPWMHVFSVANGKVGYEPISKEQAAILSASPRGPEQKQAVKKWFRENVA